jgi:hypothetical protein
VWDFGGKFAIMRFDLSGTVPDMIREKGKVNPGQALMVPEGLRLPDFKTFPT